MALPPLPSLAGVEHSRVRAGDVTLHVAQAGDPDAPPVMLVHGWPQHWWEWRGQIGVLAQTHRVICPDLRGHGWSDAPRGDYRKQTLADDLVHLLDALGHEQPMPVVGHDWGGWISFLLALSAPERVSRLLAMSIPHPWFRTRRSPEAPIFASYQLLVSTPVLGRAVLRSAPQFVSRLLRLGVTHQEAFTPRDLELYAQVLQDPDHAAATTALYRTFLTREASRRGGFPELEVPVDLLIGADDAVLKMADVPPHPGVDIEIVPGAGHFLPEERPELVLRRIQDLLAR
jgi:pimeloyl-ACP methyl ester carboxylesterase